MTNYKSKMFQAALVLALLTGNFSCNSKKPENSKEIAEDHLESKFVEKSNEKDAQFLINASEIDMEEINLGKLAQAKGNSNHVKELGKMMETEHSKSLILLTALAKLKMITIPTATSDKVNKAYKVLDKKSGNDFGKAYSEMMLNGHRNAISMFEKASEESADMEIKTYAAEMLPGLRNNLRNVWRSLIICNAI
jgi:putative membrane protein